MSAIRRLAAEAADNGMMVPELASGISRVKGVKREGTRTGNWLTPHQAETFINLPDVATLKGKRDRALLAIMIGCGLRREETAALTLERIQQRDGRWAILDLIGKGGVSPGHCCHALYHDDEQYAAFVPPTQHTRQPSMSSPSSTARKSLRNFVSTCMLCSGHAWLLQRREVNVEIEAGYCSNSTDSQFSVSPQSTKRV